MPSVGMRRTTRVFGVVKGADSARVLRSGRRLWPDSGDAMKTRRGSEDDDWFKKPEKNSDALPRRAAAKAKLEMPVVNDADEYNFRIMELLKQRDRSFTRGNEDGCDRIFGNVYSRKRKRIGAIEKGGSDDKKKFGLRFSRRQRRIDRFGLVVLVKPSCGESVLFSRLLLSVLRHIRSFGLTMKELSAFLLSEPICGVYASRGLHFLQGSPAANIGICQFFGITRFMPLFSLDFSAVPTCFKHLHSSVSLRSMFRSLFLLFGPVDVSSDVEEETNSLENQIELEISRDSFKREPSEIGTVMHDVIEISDSLSAPPSVKGSRLPGRYGQGRNLKGAQRRRTSLRIRKARNTSLVNRSNGALAADIKDLQKRRVACVASNKKHRSVANKCTAISFTKASSAVVDSTEGLDSSHCSANILITESDRCYRVEGAIVSLERPASAEWLLTVKKDGLTKCTLKAEKVMRPCSFNRYTHVIIFSLDNGWKLEFANRQDWIVFKDLYKECCDHNIPAVVAKFIPVPGVCDVSGYADINGVPFKRPDTYIFANGDELYRAMTKKTANYDMDSEDEEWLSKFNNEFQEQLSEDNFELIIDALEKVYYCNPDDCFDEKLAVNRCQDLGSKEVVEAVYNYWMRKRKQKRSSLLRVFQYHQSKKAPLIPQPLLRKRRSFKRQPSQIGRGKHPSVLHAIAAEQDALEDKNALLKIEQAKASANESRQLAIQKRKRAQSLMENADLAIYKATILVRIAEAAQAGESVDTLAEYFLD